MREVEVQILRRIPCEGGVLELLYFRKYGSMNLNLRWRELAEGEVVEALQAPPGGGERKPASAEALATLADKFGRKGRR